jgi:hypothetical protein
MSIGYSAVGSEVLNGTVHDRVLPERREHVVDVAHERP